MVGTVGAIIVAVLMAATWIGFQTYSDRESGRYLDRFNTTAAVNAGRIGTGRAIEPYPEKPFAVKNPNVFSAFAALGVGVVGTTVVLLLSISVSLHRPHPA